MDYTTTYIEKNFGLKANTLHGYIKAGAIVPDIDPGSGTGTSRKLSATNIVECLILKDLMAIRLPRVLIISMLQKIRQSEERGNLDPISSSPGNIKILIFPEWASNDICFQFIDGDLSDMGKYRLPNTYIVVDTKRMVRFVGLKLGLISLK
jgi:hypothetical protein